MKTTAILNLKGGVGKTVTAINMAAILAGDHNRRVLVIDADSQCNTTEFLSLARDGMPNTLADLLLMPELAGSPGGYQDYISASNVDGVDLLPASDELMDLDLSTLKSGVTSAGVLRGLLEACVEDDVYDNVLIDCPPAFNAASAAALVAADEVLIPVKLDAFSLQGMANLLKQVANMREINPRLRVAGLLPTMWYMDPLIIQAEGTLREKSGLHVYGPIRRSDKVNAMTFAQEPLRIYSPRSAAGIDYRAFVLEWMGGAKK